jgi:hypothetical protein
MTNLWKLNYALAAGVQQIRLQNVSFDELAAFPPHPLLFPVLSPSVISQKREEKKKSKINSSKTPFEQLANSRDPTCIRLTRFRIHGSKLFWHTLDSSINTLLLICHFLTGRVAQFSWLLVHQHHSVVARLLWLSWELRLILSHDLYRGDWLNRFFFSYFLKQKFTDCSRYSWYRYCSSPIDPLRFTICIVILNGVKGISIEACCWADAICCLELRKAAPFV